MDEDGIWRDDLESHYTFRTDSGIGTRKSSTSDLHKLPPEAGDPYSLEYRGYGDPRDTEESLPGDQKSLNISEFEASESAAGEDFSFEDHSFGSNENLDLPELNDESYLIDTGSSRPDGDDGRHLSEVDTDDLQGHSGAGTDQEGQSDAERNNDDNSIGYMLGSAQSKPSHGDRGARGRNSRLLDLHGLRGVRPGDLPAVMGESIFTQGEEATFDPRAIHQGQSLIEFEQLEAQLNDSDASGDNMDLIGAYLQVTYCLWPIKNPL